MYVGIDIAKQKHDLTVIDTEGTVFVRHLQIEKKRKGFTKLQMTLTYAGAEPSVSTS